MKKIILFFSIFVLYVACSSSNEDTPIDYPSIAGKTFSTSKVELEIPVDINGDNIFSYNLIEESSGCFSVPLTFQTNGKVINPAVNDVISFQINYTSSGIPSSQSIACPSLGLPIPNYTQSGNIVTLFYPDFSTLITGTISDDGNTISFVYTFQDFVAQSYNGAGVSGNKILNQDGSVTEYDGSITLTYRFL
jgi:hypothetical protein